jgi:hypothetical protein
MGSGFFEDDECLIEIGTYGCPLSVESDVVFVLSNQTLKLSLDTC